jgi:hypothetical protein
MHYMFLDNLKIEFIVGEPKSTVTSVPRKSPRIKHAAWISYAEVVPF